MQKKIMDFEHPSFLGYTDYAAFQNGVRDILVPSNMITGCYMTANLSVGDCLKLSWLPNRHMLVRYLGNDQFEVYEACNCKICVGDTFKGQAFVEGETLTLGGLMHNGCGPYVYVIGKQGGVSIEPIITPRNR